MSRYKIPFETKAPSAGVFSGLAAKVRVNTCRTPSTIVFLLDDSEKCSMMLSIPPGATGTFSDNGDSDAVVGGVQASYEVIEGDGGTLGVPEVTVLFASVCAGGPDQIIKADQHSVEQLKKWAEEVARRKNAEEVADRLRQKFSDLEAITDTKKRGLAFEKFLNELFHVNGLDPRGSFRVAGEQIDGSFAWSGDVILVEARWCKELPNAADLYALEGKVKRKSEWTRGVFISINGFSPESVEAFRQGQRSSLILMDGKDLSLILERQWSLQAAIDVKFRHAADKGEVYLSLAKVKK
jgi:hypothetical protein